MICWRGLAPLVRSSLSRNSISQTTTLRASPISDPGRRAKMSTSAPAEARARAGPSSLPTSSPIPPPTATRRLTTADGPLVWIDCEMTGLDAKTDRLLEVACIVTDGNLEPLDEGVSYVIRTEKRVLDAMGEWCTNQHGLSGLTAACLSPKASHHHADVRAAILAYVRERVPTQRSACLAGNTVHADAVFLKKEMPELMAHLHYRIVDVSSIKELVGRWYGDKERWSGGKGAHRALDDIQGSIQELKTYRQRFFVKPDQVRRPG